MIKNGCAQLCSAGKNVVTGKMLISIGKTRQCIAQMVETPNPKRSQSTEAVMVFSDKNLRLKYDSFECV